MKSSRMLASICLLICGSLAIAVYGQSDRGSIRGTVTDPDGAVVANAKVTITNVETNETREVTTNDEGNYNVPELKAAVYRISVEASGFKTATVDTVQVAVGVIRNGDVQLEIGVGASVTVTAEPSVLNTDSPVQQRNVTEREVRELQVARRVRMSREIPLAQVERDRVALDAVGPPEQGHSARR